MSQTENFASGTAFARRSRTSSSSAFCIGKMESSEPMASLEVATPRTNVHTPKTPACSPMTWGDHNRAAATHRAPADAASGVKGGKKNGLSTGFARRVVTMIGFSPHFYRRTPAAAVCDDGSRVGGRERTTGRSSYFGSVRSMKTTNSTGRRSNEDRFFAIDDLFRVEATAAAASPPSRPRRTPPPTPSPFPSKSSSPPAGASPPPTAALVSAAVGHVGVYGVFDGHGGASCAELVSQHLPRAVRGSPAWARLVAPRDHGDGAPATPPRPQPPAPGGPSTEGAGFEELLRGVMKEALLDGFEKTQEAALGQRGNSGATAVVALVVRRQLVIANLGDSGGLFHDGGGPAEGGPRTIRTECHTVENPAERRRVEAAGGTFAGGRLFGRMQPTRSFGDRDIQRIQKGALLAVPEVTMHQIMPANGLTFLVLGSDGLWEGVAESKVSSVVHAENERRRSKHKPARTAPRIAESLAQRAVKASQDDITAVVVLFD